MSIETAFTLRPRYLLVTCGTDVGGRVVATAPREVLRLIELTEPVRLQAKTIVQRVLIPRSLPSFPWRLAHLAALWAYGVAQPTFSMLQGNPEFLVVRGSTRARRRGLRAHPAPRSRRSSSSPSRRSSHGCRERWTARSTCRALGVRDRSPILQLTRLLDLRSGASLLLPVRPGARSRARLSALATSSGRSSSVSLALPAIGLVAFVATVPLAIDDAEAADVQVSSDVPVVLVVFDELPVSSLLTAAGEIDGVRYPAFGGWRARPPGTRGRRPRTTTQRQAVPSLLTGRLPRRGELPTLCRPPRESLHPARRRLRPARPGAGHAPVPVALLPEHAVGGSAPRPPAWALLRRLGGVPAPRRCHELCARSSLRSGSAGAGSATETSRTPGSACSARSTSKAFGIVAAHAEGAQARRVRAIPAGGRRGRAAGARCTSSTRSCRTARGGTSPPDAGTATRRRSRGSTGTGRPGQSDPSSCGSRSSATCSSWATRIDSSERSSSGSTAPVSGTRAS